MSFDSNELNAAVETHLNHLAFADASTLDERVEMIYAATGRRLYSHVLTEVWADWLNRHADELDVSQKIRLIKEMLLLSPNNEDAEALYAAIMKGRETLQPAGTPVFMVVSCAKYLEKAIQLRHNLQAHGALTWIVTGSTDISAPVWHEQGCVVPAADTYEALPLKVAKGIEALVERYGACAVVKIDDDCQLTAGFSVDKLRNASLQHDYVGVSCHDPKHDRLWHHGKTSVPTGVYARRFHGAWARGACYLLSARAAAMVAHEAVLYPGEFACEHYEDKAMGDFMRRQGVALHALPSYAWFGISVDFQERPLAPPQTAPQQRSHSLEPREEVAVSHAPIPPSTPSGNAAVATQPTRHRIPKVLHLIWVGDDNKRPNNCIQTWIDQNPGWTVKLWGNEDLQQCEWVNARHMRAMWDRELNGVADLMRWEILYNEGGIFVDADSYCVRPLDDWLLEADALACWESEIERPRLIGCCVLGSIPQNPFFGQIIKDLNALPSVTTDMAWKTVGPLCLTTAYFKYRYAGLTILPSHFFIPDHFSGVHYDGAGIVYARQEWASTHQAYDTLHLKQVA